MKKWVIITISVLFLLGIGAIFAIIQNNSETKGTELKETTELASNSINEVNTIETSTRDTKVSPNAKIIKKEYYKMCDHLKKEIEDVPTKHINKNEEDVEKMYSDWKIEGYSPNEIVIYKEYEGICGDHYIVKEHNGVLGIYKLNENGEEIFERDTEIPTQYLPEIDIQSVYNKLSDYEKSLLEGCPTNMVQYIQELNDNKKMYENQIKTVKGKIDYAQSIIDSTTIDKILTFEKDEELSLDRQQLSYLTTDKNSAIRTKQEKIVNELEKQKSTLEKQIDDLFSKMQEGKKKYLSIKNANDVCCPLCGQKLEEKGRLTTIINMKKDLEASYDKKVKLDKEFLIIKGKLAVEKAKLYSAQNVSNNEEYPGQITTLKEKISHLEQEKMDIEKHNNIVTINQKNVMTSKEDITKFNIKIQELHGLIENIKKVKEVTQKLYINYLEEKMKYATKHLKNVRIQYYKVSKEDEILKEDFIILYKNNELKNLSRSETIATMLEIGNMLNKVANTNFPLFIDDSESCADFNFIEDYAKNTQILISRVQKGQELTISNYNDKAMQIAA